jgi:hypothetical protein
VAEPAIVNAKPQTQMPLLATSGTIAVVVTVFMLTLALWLNER